LIKGGQPGGDREKPGFVHSFARRPSVEGVEEHTAGAAFRERQLIFVDKPTLHRKRDQHADDGHNDHPEHHLPPGHDHAGNQHVGRQAGNQRGRHIAGGGGNGLHRVVFQNRKVAGQAEAGEKAKQGESQNDRGQVDAKSHAGLAAHVEIGRGKDSAQKEAGQSRPKGQLGQVAPVNILQPPPILFFARPGARFFRRELGERHAG